MQGGESVTVEQPLLGVGAEEIASVTVGVGPAEGEDATTTVTLTTVPRNPEEAVARSVGDNLAAVGASLRSGETTFRNRREEPLTAATATVETRRDGDTTILVATLRRTDEPPATTHEVAFENHGDGFVRPELIGPPSPAGRAPGGGLLGTVRERLFAGSDRSDVTVAEGALRFETDWPDERTVRAEVRVTEGALLVYLLGETVEAGRWSRTEVSRSIEPPFPITVAGASAKRAAGEVSVTVPRCGAGEREEGEIGVETAE